LEAFSTLNCIPQASAALAIWPPKASISFTNCPLPTPPIAGLQLIKPMLSALRVKISVFNPSRAQAKAASIPACPAPITIISYLILSGTVLNSKRKCTPQLIRLRILFYYCYIQNLKYSKSPGIIKPIVIMLS